MEEFRPISLCNVIYKIIVKALANRLKKVFDTIISPSQSAFVPKRLIAYNVTLGFECIHAINSRRKGKEGLMALKLDMSKAYDRNEWTFLRQAMSKMRFPSVWIDRIMACTKSVNFSMLVNGSQ